MYTHTYCTIDSVPSQIPIINAFVSSFMDRVGECVRARGEGRIFQKYGGDTKKITARHHSRASAGTQTKCHPFRSAHSGGALFSFSPPPAKSGSISLALLISRYLPELPSGINNHCVYFLFLFFFILFFTLVPILTQAKRQRGH